MLISTGKPTLQTFGKKFQLAEDYVYKDKEGNVYIVPSGFITDLASIPSFLFWWQFHTVNFAAILHDFGYVNHSICKYIDDKIVKVDITREFCDRLFYQMLLEMGVNPVESYLMYLAVHLFGRFHWQTP